MLGPSELNCLHVWPRNQLSLFQDMPNLPAGWIGAHACLDPAEPVQRSFSMQLLMSTYDVTCTNAN